MPDADTDSSICFKPSGEQVIPGNKRKFDPADSQECQEPQPARPCQQPEQSPQPRAQQEAEAEQQQSMSDDSRSANSCQPMHNLAEAAAQLESDSHVPMQRLAETAGYHQELELMKRRHEEEMRRKDDECARQKLENRNELLERQNRMMAEHLEMVTTHVKDVKQWTGQLFVSHTLSLQSTSDMCATFKDNVDAKLSRPRQSLQSKVTEL